VLILSRLSTKSKEVYNENAFIPHAASRRQTFVHCVRFPVAATRRCKARVSVPFWGNMLSHPLPVVALVSHYLTNKLMGRKPFPRRTVKSFCTFILLNVRHAVLAPLSRGYSTPWGKYLRVTQPFATDCLAATRPTCMLKARR
jgi:hypothetical protein